mmetsp:Transcript_120115/g.347017  ORF Transcript_120115/g.347017 Transcript_120115/m.347017 type:complete len:292 (+) Transcript_120115:1106-1981(+)
MQSNGRDVVRGQPFCSLSQQKAFFLMSQESGRPSSQSKASQPLPCVSQQYSFFPADQPVSHASNPALQSKWIPVVVGQPSCLLRQHHAILSMDQPCAAVAKPNWQLKGSQFARPWPQQNSFFASFQPLSQLSAPALQSKDFASCSGILQPNSLFLQHQVRLSLDQPCTRPALQSKGSQIAPPAPQQKSFFGWDHAATQLLNPAAQSNSTDEVVGQSMSFFSQHHARFSGCHMSGLPTPCWQSKGSQPKFFSLQQKSFLPADHPLSHVCKPALQSNDTEPKCPQPICFLSQQ